MVNLSDLGLTIDMIGKVLLGLTVLLVHRRLMKAHRIDLRVLRELRREQFVGLSGVALIILGYVLQIWRL